MMSFDLPEPHKESEQGLFFDEQEHCEKQDINEYHESIAGSKDLFDTLSAAHYLSEMPSGLTDENQMIEALVDKSSEENQEFRSAFDQIAELVTQVSGEFNEESERMLLDSAPVSDIINRLESSLDNSKQNDITAVQSLLNLQGRLQNYEQEHHSANVDRQEIEISKYHIDETKQISSQNEPLSCTAECKATETSNNENTIHSSFTSVAPENVNTMEQEKNEKGDENNMNESCTRNEVDLFLEDLRRIEEPESFLHQHSYSSDQPESLDLSNKNKNIEPRSQSNTEVTETNVDKNDDQPKDLSCHRRSSTPASCTPKRLTACSRPSSRGSDAMQSPQPSGIPAIPCSPEPFTVPYAKSNKSLFLETLLASPSPKMCFSSELTIAKHQNEPLNLGKSRKSASPTVTSCTDELKNYDNEEPLEKRIKSENEIKTEMLKDSEKDIPKYNQMLSPIEQIQYLKSLTTFNLPDTLLLPKDKIDEILTQPGKFIPELLIARPELRLTANASPSLCDDPEIRVISLKEFENLLRNRQPKNSTPDSNVQDDARNLKQNQDSHKPKQSKNDNNSKKPNSSGILAGEIDAATSAALQQMMWLPYFSQIGNAAAAAGYPALGAYPDLSQLFGNANRLMSQTASPVPPQIDYTNPLELGMWQEAMRLDGNIANIARLQKQFNNSIQYKEMLKAAERAKFCNTQSSKTSNDRSQSSARTSPMTAAQNHFHQSDISNSSLMFNHSYPNHGSINNSSLSGLRTPPYNLPNIPNSRSSKHPQSQQKSPTGSYYQNNNYLNSFKQSHRSMASPSSKRPSSREQKDSRSTPNQNRPSSQSSSGSQPFDDSQKPRISVKNLQNLLEPPSISPHQNVMKRHEHNMPYPSHSMVEMMNKPNITPLEAAYNAKLRRHMMEVNAQRRMLGQDESEVGSTTHVDETSALHMADSQAQLWHPLFGNHKGYNSSWNWNTVTVNGE